jgi:hypothetical protein
MSQKADYRNQISQNERLTTVSHATQMECCACRVSYCSQSPFIAMLKWITRLCCILLACCATSTIVLIFLQPTTTLAQNPMEIQQTFYWKLLDIDEYSQTLPPLRIITPGILDLVETQYRGATSEVTPTTSIAPAQDSVPMKTELIVDRTTLNLNKSLQALLILHNTKPYILTDVSALFQGKTFEVTSTTKLTDTLSPYSSTQAGYNLTGKVDGSQNIVFTIHYSWYDPNTGVRRRRIETASVKEIKVTNPWAFKWPDYLIPLLVGFIISQLGTIITGWQTQRKADQEREQQAKGMGLALLYAALQGVRIQEKVQYGPLEDALIKGNLYPVFLRLDQTLHEPKLSTRLFELPNKLADYNNRIEKKILTDQSKIELQKELTELIAIIESPGNS